MHRPSDKTRFGKFPDGFKLPGGKLRDGVLLGIVTNRDIRFEADHSRPVREVMTKNPKHISADDLASEAMAMITVKNTMIQMSTAPRCLRVHH